MNLSITRPSPYGGSKLENDSDLEHICVCICTYKRPELLGNLLSDLERQETKGLFSYSVVVIDNDSCGSAREEVEEYARKTKRAVIYEIEPVQNIALARNRAVINSRGDYVAFFDDDQFPKSDWLFTLYKSQKIYQVDGVLGPVKPFFKEDPPKWLVKGKFYERTTHKTGLIIQWQMGRTGNVLIKRELFVKDSHPFDPKFGAGAEDLDFFRRKIEEGYRFVWCNEAVGYEHVPPIRWKRSFLLRRALMRGRNTLKHPRGKIKKIVNSIIAIQIYIILLPFLVVIGHHLFMKYLVKLCDHLGLVLTAIGIDVAPEKYIVE